MAVEEDRRTEGEEKVVDNRGIAVCCCLRTAYKVEGTKPRGHQLAEEDKRIVGEEGPNLSSLPKDRFFSQPNLSNWAQKVVLRCNACNEKFNFNF